MVCIPCFIVPVLIFLWHKFVQPYVLRFWNPWAVKDAEGNVVNTEFPLQCEGGVCVFKKKPVTSSGEPANNDECPTKQSDRIKAE